MTLAQSTTSACPSVRYLSSAEALAIPKGKSFLVSHLQLHKASREA